MGRGEMREEGTVPKAHGKGKRLCKVFLENMGELFPTPCPPARLLSVGGGATQPVVQAVQPQQPTMERYVDCGIGGGFQSYEFLPSHAKSSPQQTQRTHENGNLLGTQIFLVIA